MKTKAFLTVALLAASNFAFAGGLGIDNAEQHMGVSDYVSFDTSRPALSVQGPIDQFNVEAQNEDNYIVDTDRFKHNYDGQS